jgi:cytochrome c biogenesis protein CcmG/thiol:disulfide interchange protein DsbE
MKKHCTWALIMVLLGMGASMAGAQDSVVASHPMIGDGAPAFDLEEVGGGTLSLESMKGRFVVLHFGASW